MPTELLQSGELSELACCGRAGLEGTESLVKMKFLNMSDNRFVV